VVRAIDVYGLSVSMGKSTIGFIQKMKKWLGAQHSVFSINGSF